MVISTSEQKKLKEWVYILIEHIKETEQEEDKKEEEETEKNSKVVKDITFHLIGSNVVQYFIQNFIYWVIHQERRRLKRRFNLRETKNKKRKRKMRKKGKKVVKDKSGKGYKFYPIGSNLVQYFILILGQF